MEFKDYYATLGVAKTATAADIKRAYRTLARKHHPDLNKDAGAEARFKEVAEAYKALHDPEKRAAYDDINLRREQQRQQGEAFTPPPGWDSGYEYSGRGDAEASYAHSDFFEALFGRQASNGAGTRRQRSTGARTGDDHHAKIQIDLQDAYFGARRTVSLQVAQRDADGQLALHTRQLDVQIAKGVRSGQHLRLAGQGGAGVSDGTTPAVNGDLYLEIQFAAHPHFRIDDRDVYIDVPIAPWEAALGASITVPTPAGQVQLTVPAESQAGRKLRLKGKGIPSNPPGDLYAVLTLTLPPADTAAQQGAYRHMGEVWRDFNPRASLGMPMTEAP
jgi:curved DNA-binding protein